MPLGRLSSNQYNTTINLDYVEEARTHTHTQYKYIVHSIPDFAQWWPHTCIEVLYTLPILKRYGPGAVGGQAARKKGP